MRETRNSKEMDTSEVWLLSTGVLGSPYTLEHLGERLVMALGISVCGWFRSLLGTLSDSVGRAALTDDATVRTVETVSRI